MMKGNRQMKKITAIFLAFSMLSLLLFTSCQTEFEEVEDTSDAYFDVEVDNISYYELLYQLYEKKSIKKESYKQVQLL